MVAIHPARNPAHDSRRDGANRSSWETAKARRALLALNFFSADQTGIGPFFGVYLAQHGWRSGLIGTVMTLGGVTGLLMTAPAGAMVDHTRRKRAYVILSGVFTITASLAIWGSQSFAVVALSQVAGAIAAAFIGPAMLGITLGVVRQRGFNRQNGWNQAFNHAGNVAGAAVSGLLGWRFGFGPVFLMGVGLGTLSILCVLAIPRQAVDDHAARGLTGDEGKPMHGLQVLATCRPLTVLAICLALFALGNGAMLPLYGLAVVEARKADPAGFAAMVVIVAQTTMVLTSLIAMRLIERVGYWPVIGLTFLALPLRGLLAALLITSWGVFPVQVLDGIGAGLQGVAASGLTTRILEGTGRVNAGQGVVATVVGLGGALSPALGGWLAQAIGYPPTFLLMGSLSLASLAVWVGFRRTLASVSAPPTA